MKVNPKVKEAIGKMRKFDGETFVKCFEVPMSAVSGMMVSERVDPKGEQLDNPAMAAALIHAALIILTPNPGIQAGDLQKAFTRIGAMAELVRVKINQKLDDLAEGKPLPSLPSVDDMLRDFEATVTH